MKSSVPDDLLGDYYEKSPEQDVFSPVYIRILTSKLLMEEVCVPSYSLLFQSSGTLQTKLS